MGETHPLGIDKLGTLANTDAPHAAVAMLAVLLVLLL